MANILIVATGGTRAPTQIELCQRFLEDGHSVRLVASGCALRFLCAHLAREPSKLLTYLLHYRPAFREKLAYFVAKPREVPHIAEGKWADVAVMVPATCNSVGKLVAGFSDSYPLLVLRAIPRTKKIIVVPSMNPEMWHDPHFQRNIDLLNATEKYCVLCPRNGLMLCGDQGFGSQAPFEDIVTATYRALGIPGTKPEASSRAAAERAGAGRVVIVDPDTKGRREIANALRREYPEVKLRRFATATQALAWLKRNPAAVVLTELDFPHGASGLDLIQYLRRPGHEHIQIVATSARGRSVAGAERLAHLDVLFTPKPFNLPFVVGMIAGTLYPQARAGTG